MTKKKILNNLRVLEEIDRYKGISITEDLSPEKRKELKVLSQEAKTRNLVEISTDHVWRLRGCSKDGFFLKKMSLKHLLTIVNFNFTLERLIEVNNGLRICN